MSAQYRARPTRQYAFRSEQVEEKDDVVERQILSSKDFVYSRPEPDYRSYRFDVSETTEGHEKSLGQINIKVPAGEALPFIEMPGEFLQ